MSFTLSKTVSVSKSYPDLFLEIANGTETLDVTYEVTNVTVNGTVGRAEYTVTTGGVTSGSVRHYDFTYSGTGNPTQEAETALKSSMGQ
ncbi:hypothetical protein ACR9Z5_17435 [Klebsiella pneumoniae]|uniref:hypothetical protein n=1 Tax=Klebsiella pneumoniae TaxID=573 RepID=UPI0038D20DAD|nr:hypothetical protein [Klebsiella pneumoniae]